MFRYSGMQAHPVRSLFLVDIADIVNVTVTNGEIRIAVGDALSGDGRGAEVAVWGVGRFVSVPMAPDANGAAQALVEQDGNTLRCFGWRDNRVSSKAGALKDGDAALLGYGAARMLLKHADDSMTLYTETSGGDSVILTASGGDERIFGSIGSSYVEILKDEITISGGGCSIQMKGGAITMIASSIVIGGTRVSLGLMPGGIPPQAPAQGVVFGPVGATAIGSTSVAVAP